MNEIQLLIGALLIAAPIVWTLSVMFPRFTNWICRWDGDAAIKILEASHRDLMASQEIIEQAFAKAMADVDRHIKFHISLADRKARVARRRPLQRKLGRIA